MTNYTLKRLAQIADMATGTARIFLCRSEFSHIDVFKGVYYGVTPQDIRNLQKLKRW